MTTTNVQQTLSSSNASLENSKISIAQNFDQFLMLLTTQLKNQNPTSPLDTNQFTQQLVSFASVEQQIKSNENLNSLMTSMSTSNQMGALNFVGKAITANSATSSLSKGKASWQITSNGAGTGTVTISDENGRTVRTQTIDLSSGSQDFTWDGRRADGSPAPDGKYSISITGTDAQKKALTITTEVSGVVDAVDLTKSPPTLSIGSLKISLDALKSVKST